MSVSVKPIQLWRRELENRPGELALVLEPLAEVGADLRIVMGYRYPGNESRAAVELFPIRGKKATAAASQAGLTAGQIAALLVRGDSKPGVGHAITRALADAGINLDFLVGQQIGGRFAFVLGFDNDEQTAKAAEIIADATGKKKKKKKK